MLNLIAAEWRIYASVNFPSLVKTMVCRLNGAKPQSEPMLEYYEFDPCEILIEMYHFSIKKVQMSPAEWRPFCIGLNVLKKSSLY